MTIEHDPIFKSVRFLSELIKSREISSVELVNIFLGRLSGLGSKYNATVTIMEDSAIRDARTADEDLLSGLYRGPLHGIPWGAKDLLATSGDIPTTWGAAPFQDQMFEYDATVVRKLASAGAILSAKLAMIELAGGMGYRQPKASFTGPAINPWSEEHWTGGSSSGSGSAVAAGLVPFAIGSETWGSILGPANNCGVSGLRPTYGRVSRHGAMALSWTLDKLGPLCLSADDCGLVLEAIAGPDSMDLTAVEKCFKYDDNDISGKRFELAILKGTRDKLQGDALANFDASLSCLSDFASVEEIEFPDFPYEVVTRTILMAESSSAFEDLLDSGETSMLTAPEDRHPFARMAISARDYIKALRVRGKIIREISTVLSRYDAIVAPSRNTAATRIDEDFRGIMVGHEGDVIGSLGNGAGLPSISVPNGFTKDNLPTGIQFMGRAYSENIVLAVARAYQRCTEWHLVHPSA